MSYRDHGGPVWTVKADAVFRTADSMPRGWERRVFFQDAICRLQREGDLDIEQGEDLLAFGNEVL